MNYQELQSALGLVDREIIVTIIKPVRNDEVYKTGTVLGFKPGVFGGGYSDYRKDKQQKDGRGMSHPHSFSSLDMKWIKKPKVLVVYNAFTFGKSLHWDWIEVDNCEFEIKTK